MLTILTNPIDMGVFFHQDDRILAECGRFSCQRGYLW